MNVLKLHTVWRTLFISKSDFWLNTFQSHATQLRVNPEFPDKFTSDDLPMFLWQGIHRHNAEKRNVANNLVLPILKKDT
jgi:hypothetical protein